MKARIVSRTFSAAAAAVMLMGAVSFTVSADEDSSNTFTFSDNGITAASDGSGYKIDGTSLTINEAGTYTVTGECAEGSITIKKGTEGVTLILNDIKLTSAQTSPLTVGKGASAVVAVTGTNVLTDAEDPANESSTDEATAEAFEGAAVKVKSAASVTFTGSGTLTADGSACKNGIKGGETASIIVGESASDSFTLNAKAASNAISSDGSVTVNGGTVNLTSDGDGLKASPEEDDTESAGTVTVNGGTLNIVSGEDGIQADKGFTMTGGFADITTAGGYKNNKTIEAADISAKGIKSDSFITISGGDIKIDAADDGIHLNGTEGSETVSITGGKLDISSGDDGIHSDYLLNIGSEDGTADPDITVTTAVEGIEGAKINLCSGSGNIRTSEDGVNAANSDLSNYTFELNVLGGNWYVNAGGDGLDSNGNMTVSGGYTEVFGAPNGGNAALDYGDNNNSFTYTGGTVIGIGYGQMATAPTSGSYIAFGQGGMGGFNGGQQNADGTQPTPPDGTAQNADGTPPAMPEGEAQQMNAGNTASAVNITAGTKIEIKDSQGNTVYSGTGVKSANHIVLASDKPDSSETYTLYLDGTASGTATLTEGAMNQGGFPGGQGGGRQQFTQQEQTVTVAAVADKTVGDEPFDLSVSSTAANTWYMFESSDSNVVSVSSTGRVTIVGAGTATITVTAPESMQYKSASAQVTINVLEKQAEAEVTAPDKVTLTTYASSASKLRISWKAVENADGYRIYRYDKSTGKYTAVGTVSADELSFTDTGLEASTIYKYKVRAYRKDGDTVIWGEPSNAGKGLTKPLTVKATKYARSSSAIKLTWDKVTCTGYEVQMYNADTDSWETVKTAGSSATSATIKGLESGASYKFRIRAYSRNKTGTLKKYGAWSSTYTLTTK